MIANILISYLILRKHKIDSSNALLSTFGLFLISDIAWSLQYNYTHTALAITTVLLFILQFIRLLNRPTVYNYCFVGLIIACSILSKYNTILTIVGVLFASLSIESSRNLILKSKFLITLLTIYIIVLPHFNWVLSTNNPLVIFKDVLKIEDISASSLPILSNLIGTAALFTVQILPLIISLALNFNVKLVYNLLKIVITNRNQNLLNLSFIITTSMLLFLMIISGARDTRIHWLLPVVLFLPLALPLAAFSIGQINRYANGVFISAVVVKVILFTVMTVIDIWAS